MADCDGGAGLRDHMSTETRSPQYIYNGLVLGRREAHARALLPSIPSLPEKLILILILGPPRRVSKARDLVDNLIIR